MSFALTFGGFGDFVTLGQLVMGTCTLLYECYHADADIEETVAFLTEFNNSTLALLSPFVSPRNLPGSSACLGAQAVAPVHSRIKSLLESCRRDVTAFMAKVAHRQDVVQRTADGVLGQVRRRLRWTWTLKSEAEKLRRDLTTRQADLHLALSILTA